MSSDKPTPTSKPNRPSGSGSALHPAASLGSLRTSAPQTHASPLVASVDKTSAFAETGDIRLGRALSVGRRARDDWIVSSQEKTLASDPKFRKYGGLVERTLLSIDQVNEWADFITFLAKLLKTLQSHPQYAIIPHKLTVAKRLSQCLNPALPQGVHQRALEVYIYILKTVGSDGLRRDLQVWSTGLFPFFQYAATAVRPIVLGLFETFYLPLKADLRPAMKAFILALLPGLEEETGEHFDRVCTLLDQLADAVSLPFFLQNVWLVLITASGSRISALNFLNRRLPNLIAGKSMVSVVGEDVGLLVRAYTAALEDSNLLVQRGTLDLLLSNFQLDSDGFRSETRRHDQLLLMRAALGVVLRRDLSLSRRLYTWLLGPAVTTEDLPSRHLTYFGEHGLALVADSLRDDMKSKSLVPVVERQRPFKIFIALLDKWEVGEPLTKVLVLDAFMALKKLLKLGDMQDELLLTANMMFDALDPFTTWKRLFNCVEHYMSQTGEEEDSLALVKFIVASFKLNDDEILQIHIPLLALALIDMVDHSARSSCNSLSTQVGALELATSLLRELPEKTLKSGAPSHSSSMSQSNHDFARQFYAVDTLKQVESACLSWVRDPQAYAKALSGVLQVVARDMAKVTPLGGLDILNASLSLLETLLHYINSSGCKVTVEWTPAVWIDTLLLKLPAFPATALGFNLVQKVVRVLLRLADDACISPSLILDDRSILTGLILKLLEFLQGHNAPFFLQATQLVWELEGISLSRHVETVIASRLASQDTSIRELAFEAFGNLWKYTDDSLLPGTRLRLPMLIVLESLKSVDLGTRRFGEAWMRCSLKSYLRVLDPLLQVLLGRGIKRKSYEVDLGDRSLQVFHYVHPFDQALVHHALESVLTLTRFGGQGFTRIAKTSLVKHTHDQNLHRLLQAAHIVSASYLDALVKLLLLFINSDPEPALLLAMSAQNDNMHATAADLIQMIVARGDLTLPDLRHIEATLSSRLLIAVRCSEFNLQNKFLHALHATISAAATATSSHQGISQESSPSQNKADSPHFPDSPLFAVILADGITAQRNMATVHHWIDFLLMTIPQFRRSLDNVVNPLIDRLNSKLDSLLAGLETTYRQQAPSHPGSDVTDSDFSVFVNALERLIVVAIEDGVTGGGSGEGSVNRGAQERSAASESGPGIFSGVFNVLGSAESTTSLPMDRPKTEFQTRLGSVVTVMMKAWNISSQIHDVNELDSSDSKSYFSSRLKLRARKTLDRIYKLLPSEVLEAIVDYWQAEIISQPLSSLGEDNVFMLLDHLSSSAQTVVTMLYDRLSAFAHAYAEKARSPSFLSESVLFAFLESYVSRLEGPIAVQIWSSTLNFAREVLGNSTNAKTQAFPTFKCFTILAEKISQTSALEDRRMRRDVQDTFVKLCDISIQGVGKLLEQNKGRLEPSGEVLPVSLEKDSSRAPLSVPSSALEDKRCTDFDKSIAGAEVMLFLAEKALPACRRFLIESDKLSAVYANMMYYIITPALKARCRSLATDEMVINILIEMTKHPAVSKAWRSQVIETFNDPKFFSCSREVGRRWKPIIHALLNTDRERFIEMLSRLSTAPSGSIFTNKESEMISRSMSLRRITYAIYSADYNRFLLHLPSIQGKVVDLLRSHVGEIVHAEVYLCLRVLLCRIANQHLSGFWPVILTEMTRLFESMSENLPETPHQLALALSASKFLDLLLVLKTEDFQIHQWIFITDTVDAVYPPDSWYPHAIIDRVAECMRERLGSQRSTRRKSSPTVLQNSMPIIPPAAPPLCRTPSTLTTEIGHLRSEQDHLFSSADAPLKRVPLLLSVKNIDNFRPLERYFSKISLVNYEACYSGGSIDSDAVEFDLESDLFDGKAT